MKGRFRRRWAAKLMPEDEQTEDKESLAEWKEAAVSLAAFATAKGGTVRFGYKSDGRRVGVQLGANTLERLAEDIKHNTDPPLYPSITLDEPTDTPVVTVQIEESPVKPVWAFGRPVKRVGRTNQHLSADETKRLIEQTTGRTWDGLPCSDFRVADIDQRAVDDFLRRAGQGSSATTESVLENLGFLTPHGLCNGAALLFAQNPQRFFAEAQVKCARFLGTTSVQFLDQQTLDGGIVAQAEQALAFVARNTRQAIRITGRAERETVPEYPETAIREAVANAVCHRDYAANGTVQIRIYDDRLEVWSPGLLPPQITLEELVQEHSSYPRNPKLAAALYRARVIEKWGTGTLRMVQACEAQGAPRPEFVLQRGTFIVRFPRPVETVQLDLFPSLRINDRQRQAIRFVLEQGRITRSQYRTLVSLSDRQAARDLSALVSAGVFWRANQGAATYYALSPDALREA